jgi:hypothetical protein
MLCTLPHCTKDVYTPSGPTRDLWTVCVHFMRFLQRAYKENKTITLTAPCNKLIRPHSNTRCFWLVWLNRVCGLQRAGKPSNPWKESEPAVVGFLFIVVQPFVVSCLIPYVQNSCALQKTWNRMCVCIDVQIQIQQLFHSRRLRGTRADFCKAVMHIFLDVWLCKR